MEWIAANIDNVFEILVGIVGIAAVVATMTPNESDNAIVQKVLDFVNLLGANFGKAKNN
tara:strand:+ start:1118 stop:1294 length:177 start_codon:yes stop_codon:yes gene_type:complete